MGFQGAATGLRPCFKLTRNCREREAASAMLSTSLPTASITHACTAPRSTCQVSSAHVCAFNPPPLLPEGRLICGTAASACSEHQRRRNGLLAGPHQAAQQVVEAGAADSLQSLCSPPLSTAAGHMHPGPLALGPLAVQHTCAGSMRQRAASVNAWPKRHTSACEVQTCCMQTRTRKAQRITYTSTGDKMSDLDDQGDLLCNKGCSPFSNHQKAWPTWLAPRRALSHPTSCTSAACQAWPGTREAPVIPPLLCWFWSCAHRPPFLLVLGLPCWGCLLLAQGASQAPGCAFLGQVQVHATVQSLPVLAGM